MSTRLGSALPRPGGGRHLQRLGRFQLVVRRPGPLSRDGTRLLPPALHLSQTIRRLSSTLVPPPRVKPDVERLRQQPAKIILDYLTPMPSHLLTTLLSDLEPCGADTSQGGAATLLRGPGPAESSPIVQSPPRSLPQGHHLVYFPIQSAPSHLAPDGADVDHSPGLHYSRRLWAGGEVVFRGIDGSRRQEGLVLDGRPWTCTETIGDVRVKESGPAQAEVRVGDKVFVDVWRRYALGHPANQESLPWSIEERRTLVFMNPGEIVDSRAPTASKTVKYPHEAAHSVHILPSPRHLFHFSALTFNAHAIHLDPQYARSVDGHRAPLVHGPLTLALMLRVLTAYSGQCVSRFVYRNHTPLYVNEPFTVKVRPVPSRTDCNDHKSTWDAWVEGPDGGLAAKGTATMSA